MLYTSELTLYSNMKMDLAEVGDFETLPSLHRYLYVHRRDVALLRLYNYLIRSR